MQTFEIAGRSISVLAYNLGAVALAIVAALVAHSAGMFLLRRLAARTPGSSDDLFVEHGARPARWIAVGIALAAVRRFLTLSEASNALWTLLAGLIVPLLIGWLAIAMVRALGK